jgi:hypothetical protein
MPHPQPHIGCMRVALALYLLAAPVLAQETPPAAPPQAEEEDGFSLVEEGAKLVLRGLMTEMEPAFDEMEKALSEVGPKLEDLGAEIGPRVRQLIALIDDFKNYEAPVMLPNGDILIRRTAPPVPRFDPKTLPQPGPNGEIEL